MKRESFSPRPRVMRLAPRGVTLSEVLVSMLVMGIGVVAVATIFPLSVLRTIQATQLTHATQLRYNFEGLSGCRPELIYGAGAWQPNTVYAQGDIVVSPNAPGYYFECQQPGTSGVDAAKLITGQPDGSVEWNRYPCKRYVVDPLGWQERTEEMRTLGLTPALGQADIRNTFGRWSLGTNPNVLPLDWPYRITRFRGGVARNDPPFTTTLPNPHPSSSTFFPAVNSLQDIASQLGARELATLPDSWVVQFETTEFQLSPSSAEFVSSQSRLIVTLDRNADNQLDFQGAERDVSARITFFNNLGTRSVTRPITTVTSLSAGSETVTWVGGGLPALPAGDGWVRARVETWEQRYSWLLAVRVGQNDTLNMDLVVFFRRSLAPEDELIHPAHFRVSGSSQPNLWPGQNGDYEAYNPNNPVSSDDVADLNVDALGNVASVLAAGADGLLGTADDVTGKSLVVVRYHPDLGAGSPFLQRGGYLCDAQNNRWYRISSYHEVREVQAVMQLLDGNFDSSDFSGRGAVIRLETPVLESSGSYTPNSPGPGGAMFLRGIVEVYPLQQR